MNNRDLAFVDTNVLVYAFDKSESDRRLKASKLLDRLMKENRFCLSTQVLQEFFVTVTRKIQRPVSVEKALEIMEDLIVWNLFTVDYEAIHEAGLMSRKLRMSFWDALILVAAKRLKAEALYTEDFSHSHIIMGVRIINPFKSQERSDRD